MQVVSEARSSVSGAIKEGSLERTSEEESYGLLSASDIPVGGPAPFREQFEFDAGDRHNWQGRSDERIKLAVMTALHWDLAVPRDRVQVSVDRRMGDAQRDRSSATMRNRAPRPMRGPSQASPE